MLNTSFKTLVTSVRSCTLCAHELELGARPILQVHPKARILIAGQAPGSKVHQSGIRFDDASGDRLIGKYAQDWHLPFKHKTLTDTVRHWAEYDDELLPLPHLDFQRMIQRTNSAGCLKNLTNFPNSQV